MIEIKLPIEPVDLYCISWWELSITENWCYISPQHATYYVNASYEKATGEQGGVPLVDQWMLYKENYPTGRSLGWGNPLNKDYLYACFYTEKEAYEEALIRLNNYARQARHRLSELEALTKQTNQRLKSIS